MAGKESVICRNDALAKQADRIITAAIGAVISLILAVIYVVAGKMWSIDGVFYCSGLSAFAATLPVVYRGDVVLVPNVLLPILMLILCFLAYKARKRPEEKPAGIRLKQRK